MHDKVKLLLQNNQKLRDNDLALIGAIWQSEGLNLTDEQKRTFMTLSSPETITRIRRRLREEYPGSEKTEEARYRKFKEYVNEYGEKVAIFL